MAWELGQIPAVLEKMQLSKDSESYQSSTEECDPYCVLGNNSSIGPSGGFNESGWTEGGSGYDMLRYSMGWTVVLICAYAGIFLIGILGNVMVFCVLVFRPQAQMKTVTNLFILNLCIADMLVIIFCVGPTLLSNILISWVLGPFMCKAVAYVQGVSVCASVYSLVAISLDRFLACVFSTKMPRGLSKSQARIIIFFIWISATSIASPWTVVFTLKKDGESGNTYCLESWTHPMNGKMYFIIGNLILCYALPVSLVIVSNMLIWLHVAKRPDFDNSASPAAIKRVHRKTRHGVLRMLTVVTLTFLVSWLPLYVIFLLHKIGVTLPEEVENLIPFAQWLGASNSSYNPILYFFVNKKFRESFRSLIACPGSKQGGSRNYNTTNTCGTTGNSISLNHSYVSGTSPPPHQVLTCKQKRSTFRYPIVRV